MTTLNHERPYLKYIDNLRRELKIEGARGERPARAKGYMPPKGLLNKLDRIKLQSIEYERIGEILALLTEESDLFFKSICAIAPARSGISKPGMSKHSIEVRRKAVRSAIEIASVELMISDLKQRNAGRSQGVFDWFNIFGRYLYKVHAEMSWDYLKSCFESATELLVNAALEHTANHND